MSNFTSAFKAFVADENGVTALEYGLIAALIGVVIASAASDIGTKLKAAFTFINGKLPATYS
jgi:pilus assembly protein Flp/PilA